MTRIDDRANSLMEPLGVNMPTLYVEGKNAFRHLQLEAVSMWNDQSIVATEGIYWEYPYSRPSLNFFERCDKMALMDHLRTQLLHPTRRATLDRLDTFRTTNRGNSLRSIRYRISF